MFELSIPKVLERIGSSRKVLDIGGWACPFNRANWIMDEGPYETRGFYKTVGLPGSQGGEAEHFTKETWIQRDICAREPYPFGDKDLDFVICSHTLEDLRDPLWVCSEMCRIARAGYIEVPSREVETCRGWESPRTAGLSHHRWLIDINGSEITFLMKLHMIHQHWRFNFPPGHLHRLPEAAKVQFLFWEGGFSFRERIIHGHGAMAAELERFVQSTRPYSASRLAASRAWGRLTRETQRVVRGVLRRLQPAKKP